MQMPIRISQTKMWKRFTNAYMLVYIRESALGDVLVNVTEEDVPENVGILSV